MTKSASRGKNALIIQLRLLMRFCPKVPEQSAPPTVGCLRQHEESSTMIISFSLHNSCSNKMCQVILTKPNSVQGLIGLERFTRFGVKTDKAELSFFSVEPTNISVLSAANIDVKIHHLMMLLSTIPDLEILALDSCECFDSNKNHLRKRLEKEQNEAVIKLLQADYDFLDEIQVEMSTARQFMFAVRFRREKDEQIFSTLNRVDKAISEHGFAARRMSKPEIKRMLALYFGTSISGDDIPDIEGENEFDLEKQEVTVNEK